MTTKALGFEAAILRGAQLIAWAPCVAPATGLAVAALLPGKAPALVRVVHAHPWTAAGSVIALASLAWAGWATGQHRSAGPAAATGVFLMIAVSVMLGSPASTLGAASFLAAAGFEAFAWRVLRRGGPQPR